MKTRGLCLYLCLMILFALLPTSAMAADSKFVKVNSKADLVNGQYLVVAHDANDGYVAMGQEMFMENYNLNSLPVTVVDDTVTLSDPTGFVWTVEVYNNGDTVRLVNENGQYLSLMVNFIVAYLIYGDGNGDSYWTYDDAGRIYIHTDTFNYRATDCLEYNYQYDNKQFDNSNDTDASESFTFYKLVNSMSLTEEETRQPKTGDSSLPMLWLGLGLTSAAGAVLLLRRRKHS